MINWPYWVLFIVFWYITVFLHDIGHSLMSRILFNDKNPISIGKGKPLFTTKRFIINSSFWYFGDGPVHVFKCVGMRYQRILHASGGFFMNIILAGLLYLLALFISHNYLTYYFSPWWWPVIPMAIFTNALGVFFSIVPFPYKSETGMPNDGRYIMQLIFKTDKY